MKDFISYEQDTGLIFFIKRSAITSFVPQYVRTNCYRVSVSDGLKEGIIHQSDTLQEAKDWCLEQIEIIEGECSGCPAKITIPEVKK